MKFGPWMPDQPALDNPGVIEAKNVLPNEIGYVPWPSLQTFSNNAMDAWTRGAFSTRDKDGNIYIHAGDAAKLYEIQDGTFVDVSIAGSPAYDLGTEETWEFIQWEQQIIACSGVNADTAAPSTNDIQAITLGATNYADLGGTPPQARHIAKVDDFVVVGNTWDASDGLVPGRVRWSAKGDEASWTVSASTQADFEDSLTGGWCQRIVGGEYGIVFMEHSIHRMEYVGSPTIFRFSEVLPNHGTPAPGSVAQIGEQIFYLSQEGFNVLENGSTNRHIGSDAVDEWFWDRYEQQYFYRLTAAVDPNSHRVFWSFVGTGATGETPNFVLCFDYHTNRWTYSEQTVVHMLPAATTGYTMDGLDAVNVNLDLIVPSLDSRVWQGGAPQIGLFDGDYNLAFWTGIPLSDAILTSPEQQLSKPMRTLLTEILPEIDGGTTTVRVGYRQKQSDAVVWTPIASLNAQGRHKPRKNARYHRIELTLNDSWANAVGMQIDGQPAGRR